MRSRTRIRPGKHGAGRWHVCWRWRWSRVILPGRVKPPNAGAPLLSPADTNPLNATTLLGRVVPGGVYEFSHLFPGNGHRPDLHRPGLLVYRLPMPFSQTLDRSGVNCCSRVLLGAWLG